MAYFCHNVLSSTQHLPSNLHQQDLLSVIPLFTFPGILLIHQTPTGSITLSSGMDTRCTASKATIRSVSGLYVSSYQTNHDLIQNFLLPFCPGSEYFEDTGLSPYTNYSYWLVTANVAGSTTSAAAPHQTLGAPPEAEKLNLNLVGRASSTSASFNWSMPQNDTGPVDRCVHLRTLRFSFYCEYVML